MAFTPRGYTLRKVDSHQRFNQAVVTPRPEEGSPVLRLLTLARSIITRNYRLAKKGRSGNPPRVPPCEFRTKAECRNWQSLGCGETMFA